MSPERLEKYGRRGLFHSAGVIQTVFDLRFCHLLRSDGECVQCRSAVRAVKDVPLQIGSVNFLARAVPEDAEVAPWKDVYGIVIDDVVGTLVLPRAGVRAVDDVLLPGGPARQSSVRKTAAHPLAGEDVVKLIAPDHIAFPRSGDVDPGSVAQLLQHALHFVILDDVCFWCAETA